MPTEFPIDPETEEMFKEDILPKVIPVITTIVLFMLLGVIGNAVVIYIFGFSLNRCTIHFFIVLLAIFDIVCCAFGFPMEITEFFYSLRYPSNAACKFQRLVTFACSLGSTLMLLVISIERYRKVCWAALSELSSKWRKIFTVATTILSICLALPMVLFSSRRPYNHHLFPNTTCAICSLPSFSTQSFPQYYLFGLLLFMTAALVTMLVLYYRVWRTAKRHFTMKHSRRQRHGEESDRSTDKKRLGRTTRTVIATTVLFALSFFPGLLLSILVLKLPPFLHTFSAEVAYFTTVRLYILNSAFNPFVYGYFNEQFRYEAKKLFAKVLRIRQPQTLDFSSDNTR